MGEKQARKEFKCSEPSMAAVEQRSRKHETQAVKSRSREDLKENNAKADYIVGIFQIILCHDCHGTTPQVRRCEHSLAPVALLLIVCVISRYRSLHSVRWRTTLALPVRR